MDWYEPRIIAGVADFARSANWALILDYAQVHRWPDSPGPLDGLIVLLGPHPTASAYVLQLNIPFVTISDADEGLLANCHRVLWDEELCGKIAAEHLLQLGFRHFFVLRKPKRTLFEDRYNGFRKAVEPLAKSLRTVEIGESISSHELAEPICRMLKQCKRPLGIFCPADILALHMSRCAESQGWQVPQDAAIVGVDNNEIVCDYAPVPITSVGMNYREAGYRAAEMLQKVLTGTSDGRSKQEYVIAPTGVTCRRSTDAMGVEDARLMNALQIIRTDYPRILGLSELASAVGLSNNQLSRLFAQHLGRSLPEEVNRVRIEAARRLLTETKDSVKEIAFRCGFSSPNYFNKIFKEHTGQKPSAFRHSAAAPPTFKPTSPHVPE